VVLILGDGKKTEITGLSGGEVEIKIAQFIRLSGKDGEGVSLGRFRKVFGSIVDLVKINTDRRVGNGLAGGQRGAVGVNLGGI